MLGVNIPNDTSSSFMIVQDNFSIPVKNCVQRSKVLATPLSARVTFMRLVGAGVVGFGVGNKVGGLLGALVGIGSVGATVGLNDIVGNDVGGGLGVFVGEADGGITTFAPVQGLMPLAHVILVQDLEKRDDEDPGLDICVVNCSVWPVDQIQQGSPNLKPLV